MANRSDPLSLGYYGFLAIIIGTVFVLVGMRPGPRSDTAGSTRVTTITGSALVAAGTVAIGVHAWREQRERRRAAEAAATTKRAHAADSGGGTQES